MVILNIFIYSIILGPPLEHYMQLQNKTIKNNKICKMYDFGGPATEKHDEIE